MGQLRTKTTSEMRRRPPVAMIRTALVAAALIGGLGACASEDDSGATPAPAGDASTTLADTGGGSGATDEADAPDGAGTGTLTLADDTVHELVMSTCETSENDDAFLVEDGYDLYGRTADGAWEASFNRAGFDESSVSEISTLEGDFDEDGKNAGILYSDVNGTMALTVDGGNVSGTLTLKPIGPNRPYGDEIEATVDITC